jgi:hypothetical protein
MLEFADGIRVSRERDVTAAPRSQEKTDNHTSAGHVGSSPLNVVGIDGSAPSWDALTWAAGEALRTANCELTAGSLPSS